MTAWTDHCKQYAKQHNCSYAEALKRASSTYQKQGSGINLNKAKKVVNRTAKQVKKGTNKTSNLIDKHGRYISYLDEDLGNDLQKFNTNLKTVSSVADKTINQTGGKISAKRVLRKVKNTSKRVSKTLDTVSPFVSMVNPEAGMALETVNSGIKIGNAVTGGSLGSKKNKYISGGSAYVPKIGGRVVLASSQSSLISPHHPSFRPPKPKSIKQRQLTN